MDRLFRVTSSNISGADQSPSAVDDWVIAIEQADYVEGYVLRLQFSDGQERLVDFEPFLQRSLNPLIKKYLDPTLFRQFTVEEGDLFWNDYDLCFPIADLYEGTI